MLIGNLITKFLVVLLKKMFGILSKINDVFPSFDPAKIHNLFKCAIFLFRWRKYCFFLFSFFALSRGKIKTKRARKSRNNNTEQRNIAADCRLNSRQHSLKGLAIKQKKIHMAFNQNNSKNRSFSCAISLIIKWRKKKLFLHFILLKPCFKKLKSSISASKQGFRKLKQKKAQRKRPSGFV